MTTKDEALKLALEVLEEIADEVFSPYDNKLGEVILALRERLAQPEQEPVATVESKTGNPDILMSWWHEPALPVGTKLYTTPPRRGWVRLTVREIEWCFADANGDAIVAARNIEAKLREKNA